MPKLATELSALAVKRLSKPGLHAVGGVPGLMLRVTDTGGRYWVLRARVGGRRRDIGLGSELTLAQARQKAAELRREIREGRDPVSERAQRKQALRAEVARRLTFARAAELCHAAKAPEFRNAKHASQWLASLERYANPVIGTLDVADVELTHVMAVLEPIWRDKTETATRVRGRIEQVLAWATVAGHRTGDNPARWSGNLDQLLPAARKLKRVRHFASMDYREVPEFIAELRQRDGTAARALEFAVLTAARSGEVRGMCWDELDGDVWTVPAGRIKAGRQHRVPLSERALEILDALPRVGELVFAAPRGGEFSDAALGAVLKRMDRDCTAHGFRSSFKEWARAETRFADEVSELALAHVSTDATRAAYARDELLDERRKLMAAWARFIDGAGTVRKLRVAS